MKKAVVFLKGGFGNQLFQISFSHYLEQKGYKVSINLDKLNDFDDQTPRQLILPLSLFGLKKQSYLSKKIFYLLNKLESSSKVKKSILYNFVRDYKYSKDDVELESLNSKKYFFDGYWKNMEIVEFSKEYMIECLKKDNQIMNGFKNKTNKTMVHVRRGDFVKDNRHLNVSFYEESLKLLNSLKLQINYDIFTDDYEWVKSQIEFNSVININAQKLADKSKSPLLDGKDNKNETLKDFSRMLSYSNFIIGNSSYSFWAALIGSDNDSVVIVAEPWFRDHQHPVLKLDNWYSVKNV